MIRIAVLVVGSWLTFWWVTIRLATHGWGGTTFLRRRTKSGEN